MIVPRKIFYFLLPLLSGFPQQSFSQSYDSTAHIFASEALKSSGAYIILNELCTTVGARIAGSTQAAKAVAWAQQKMVDLGFQNVHLEPVMVPHWVRGNEEGSFTVDGGRKSKLHLCALGGSVGTVKRGITAEIIEIKSWDELKTKSALVKGKIVFYNRPMDRTLISPGMAYGLAVDQRALGASEAAKLGAVAALVRSMTTRIDDVPHTGQLRYDTTAAKIPAAAISTKDAENLSALLSQNKKVRVTLKLGCSMLPDVESANVIGEITGVEKPEEIVAIGAHLDSWDKGQGAHDDGAGCAHVLEALHLIKNFAPAPKRTIRVILFMNEENGINGGIAYAAERNPKERHIAAIETDAGGFSPRGFTVSDSMMIQKLQGFSSSFRILGADRFMIGHTGSDLLPLGQTGVATLGLQVDGQKYFDYHHSDSDVIQHVNDRELALGAAAMAEMAYIIAQEGL